MTSEASPCTVWLTEVRRAGGVTSFQGPAGARGERGWAAARAGPPIHVVAMCPRKVLLPLLSFPLNILFILLFTSPGVSVVLCE